MAASGSVFSETLQTITNTKLEELSKQQISYEDQCSSLLAAAKAEQDPLKRLLLLVDGAKACLGVKTALRNNKDDSRRGRVIFGGTSNTRLETDLKNLDRFLEQARYDPSVSPKVLEDWEKCVLQYLSIQSSKYQYADLYAKLVTEWLSSERASSPDSDIQMVESFEEIPGAKKLEARSLWEKNVFEPACIDIDGLNDYLQKLFITKKKRVSKAIDALREKVEQLEFSLTGTAQFNIPTLRWVIEGLQNSDLLSNEKREVLKDFLSNDIILAEIADVLNMRISALSRWSWGEEVPLEQRRKLGGGYSIHMHEDLLQAIFLHYIGVKWSVFFRQAFLSFRSDVWKSNHTSIPKIYRKRREYYLGDTGTWTQPNLEDRRANTHRTRYFGHQLLDHDTQRIQIQEGEEEAEYAGFVQPIASKKRKIEQDDSLAPTGDPQNANQNIALQAYQQQLMLLGMQNMKAVQRAQQDRSQQPAPQNPPPPQQQQQMASQSGAQMPYGTIAMDDEDDIQEAKNPMEAKQGILHLLSAEIVVNTRLHGELTCFRSVFESWNPLLPHDTILAVLKFFGVSSKWIHFFKTFLQAPLKFTDDQDAAPRLRRRGTPGSHTLSDVFGEAVLFCLDFSVNQSADGGLLYRLYDDFWFWSHDYDKCVKAWSSVQQFTKAMNVQLSDAKTGSVRITRGVDTIEVDDFLPEGQIRWGFLYLDPSTGRFEIDKKMVDSHIEELRKQLQSKSKSVIDWIQAWNSYAATFFSSNFGKAANCFGREHVDKMLATHRDIQESIFEGGNVVQFLKKTIKERFNVNNIPDGFLFFPVELGGLDLKSPFVGLLQIREAVRENPYDLMDEYEEAEQEAYAECKRIFDRGEVRDRRYGYGDRKWKPDEGADEFFSFEEFVRYREEFHSMGRAELDNVYGQLLRKPKEESIDVSIQVKNALDQLCGQSNLRGIVCDWNAMEAYWKWVAQMYGPEMIEKFGGLNVVDPGLLPIGMVSMFRQKRIKWQG